MNRWFAGYFEIYTCFKTHLLRVILVVATCSNKSIIIAKTEFEDHLCPLICKSKKFEAVVYTKMHRSFGKVPSEYLKPI